MTEFRTEKLSDAQRLHALEQRVQELEALVDGLFETAYAVQTCDPADELPVVFDEPLTEEELAEARKYFREGPL